jgi:hypothetical protein
VTACCQAGRRRAAGTEGDPLHAGRYPAPGLGLAGDATPGADGELVTVDIYATIVTSCSEKDQASGPLRLPPLASAESREWLLVHHYRSLRICPNLSLVSTRRGDDARTRGSSGRWSPGHTERLGGLQLHLVMS